MEVQNQYAMQIQVCYDPKLANKSTREEAINNTCKTIASRKTSEIVAGKLMQLLQSCMDEENFCD